MDGETCSRLRACNVDPFVFFFTRSGPVLVSRTVIYTVHWSFIDFCVLQKPSHVTSRHVTSGFPPGSASRVAQKFVRHASVVTNAWGSHGQMRFVSVWLYSPFQQRLRDVAVLIY